MACSEHGDLSVNEISQALLNVCSLHDGGVGLPQSNVDAATGSSKIMWPGLINW